jgi:uncharacterized membrane protein YdjX (TVP38/TMEM64 family)
MPEEEGLEISAIPPQAKATKALLFLLLLVAVVAGVRLFHLQDYLEEERLRQIIASFGLWGPVMYLVIWTLAPAMFLPGLPITLAGGVLFGPIWGVIYTAIGSTAGAALAFLVARYLARDWVAAKLAGSKLSHLDDKVALHGWKIVAFTRIIGLPYFLLNYAFGITRVSLTAFAVATFFAMLPWTIALVLFSSNILSLLRGEVSVWLVIGVILVAIFSLIPIIYKKVKAKEGVPLEL